METTAHKIEAKERTSDVKLSEKIPFNKMMLSAGVRNGLHRAGYVYPTVLQASAIPIGKAGIDLIVQSKSGTGKTLIFSVVLLETIYDAAGQHPQSLVLAPTREIAIQIENTLNVIGSCCPGFKAVSVIGGLDVTSDRKKIQNARAIVGTPGRVVHLIHNEVFNTSDVKLLVIDEADKMMNSTFRGDFEKIYNSLPGKKQIIACSATFCNELDTELAKFMRNPFLISTEKRSTSLLGIKQLIYELPEEKTNILEMQAKVTALCRIFSNVAFKQCMVFSNSQSRAESYRSFLTKEGWPCEVITGGQDQKMRIAIFNKFREFKTRILVSTDLMARGIDSENVNLVINLELPDDDATYLHRVGRAGRFGSHGIAITFIASRKDREKFRKLLDKIGFAMEILKFPKNNIVDLWNFNDPEGEKLQLGIFDINENTECEKENINTNCITDTEILNCIDSNVQKQNMQNDIKRDVLKHLIDLKLPKLISNRNGNLFSDFIEEINSDKAQEKQNTGISEETSRKSYDKPKDAQQALKVISQYIDEDLSNLKISKNSLLNLVCDAQNMKCEEARRDLFEDFVCNEKSDFGKEKCSDRENDTQAKFIEPGKNQNVINVEGVVVSQDFNLVSQLTQKSVASKQQEEKNIPADQKNSLRSLLVENKSAKNREDIFEDFEGLQERTSKAEVSSTVTLNESNRALVSNDSNSNQSKVKTPKSQESKNVKRSKEAIQEAIREVHDNIVSTSESTTQLASLKSFSEMQPSTSMQPFGPSSDNSDATNYPNTSFQTSANQTNQDMFNISSLTEDINISFNTSDLNTSAKQDADSATGQELLAENDSSSSSTRSKSSTDLDSNTETASEQNESSGFDEEDSAASSGVITSKTSSSSDGSSHSSADITSTTIGTDTSNLETSSFDSSSDSESTLESEKEIVRKRCKSKRKNRNRGKQNNSHEAYQKSFTGWTELYWNQVSQIQDYVNFYKYVKQHASQYS